uniref:Uncharacterized protein n=1 Tax=Sipha flava TaxID=143950 RepID=A0A2S2QZB0_9HEMI
MYNAISGEKNIVLGRPFVVCGCREVVCVTRGWRLFQVAARTRVEKKKRSTAGACTRNRAARLATNVCLDGHGRARPCGRCRRGTRARTARGVDWRAARVYSSYVPPPPPPPPHAALPVRAPARSRSPDLVQKVR